MNSILEKAITIVMTLCVCVLAGVLVHREFYATVAAAPTRQQSSYLPTWRQALAAGYTVGNSKSRIQLIEFTDLQCPFCRRFNEAIKTAQRAYPNDVAYTFVHYPLPSHTFAMPAARAAECAKPEDRFVEMTDVLFGGQASFATKHWSAFAKEAGLVDSIAFLTCISESTSLPAIDAGIAMGRKMEVNATPTVVLNGWRYAAPPSDTELVRAIGDLLGGRSPYKGYPKMVQ